MENKFNEKTTDIEQMESQIKEMKKAYETCPVPPEALDRVKKGIAEAKRGQRIFQFCKTAGVTAAAACLGIVVLANSSARIANAMEKIPVIGAIANVVTFRNYSDQNGNFEADVDVPQIAGDETVEGTPETTGNEKDHAEGLPGANKTIEEYADELIAMYENNLKESEGEGHYTLKSSYEVVYEDEKILSIRINSVVIMASGNEFAKIFHVDKATGNLLTLKDFLKDGENDISLINQNILEQMEEQMKKDENITYFIKSEEEPDGFESISDDTNFYLNKDGELVIVFDEYEVAPGFMGIVEFTIPKDVVTLTLTK